MKYYSLKSGLHIYQLLLFTYLYKFNEGSAIVFNIQESLQKTISQYRILPIFTEL